MELFDIAENIVTYKNPRALDFAAALKSLNHPHFEEIIATDVEVAIRYDAISVEQIKKVLSELEVNQKVKSARAHKIPVCYELGPDWGEVERQTGLKKSEIIARHTVKAHPSFYGFIPGFIYLNELDHSIKCERRSSPRSHLSAGAVGLGGEYTGIYSLASPGGWQIIGFTPESLLNPEADNPFRINTGDFIQFYAITQAEYEQWNPDH